MHANITIWKVRRQNFDDAASAWESLLGKQHPPEGLRRADYLLDRETGESVVVGVWETEQDARAFESTGAYQQAVSEVAGLYEGEPRRRVYEVAAHIEP